MRFLLIMGVCVVGISSCFSAQGPLSDKQQSQQELPLASVATKQPEVVINPSEKGGQAQGLEKKDKHPGETKVQRKARKKAKHKSETAEQRAKRLEYRKIKHGSETKEKRKERKKNQHAGQQEAHEANQGDTNKEIFN